jgi:hypothetical protein
MITINPLLTHTPKEYPWGVWLIEMRSQVSSFTFLAMLPDIALAKILLLMVDCQLGNFIL